MSSNKFTKSSFFGTSVNSDVITYIEIAIKSYIDMHMVMIVFE